MANDFKVVFTKLRGLMLQAAPCMTVATDTAGALELRTKVIDKKTRQPGWFGAVTVKKSYVAYHLMPLYAHPELAEGISAELSKRRQGKTCFNFSRVDETLFAEIRLLTKCCANCVDP